MNLRTARKGELSTIFEASHLIPAASNDTWGEKSSLRILIVDDNRDAAESLAMVLKIMENVVRTASDGEQGIRLVKEFRPDVALCDIGMPKLNG